MKQSPFRAGALACLLLAAASASAQQAGAADPQAAVPATDCRPAIDYRAPARPAASPDANWRASNDTVARTNSMALTMKSMGGHAGHQMDDMAPPAAAPQQQHEGMYHDGMHHEATQ